MKDKILWRVYLIWFFRRIVPLMALQALFLIVSLKVFAKLIFVAEVFSNAAIAAHSGYWEFFQYLGAAFVQTRPAVQFSIFLALGLGALILRDLGRTILAYIETFRSRA